VRGWVAAGARLVGGCCRVGPEQITAVAGALHTEVQRPASAASGSGD
jgi:S-methylmethionine-dependent homocysteine/selenocysteine methylase